MATLKEIIKENGENYMELVRTSESIKDLAREMGYVDCDNCGDWLESSEMVITSGMESSDICENCYKALLNLLDTERTSSKAVL